MILQDFWTSTSSQNPDESPCFTPSGECQQVLTAIASSPPTSGWNVRKRCDVWDASIYDPIGHILF